MRRLKSLNTLLLGAAAVIQSGVMERWLHRILIVKLFYSFVYMSACLLIYIKQTYNIFSLEISLGTVGSHVTHGYRVVRMNVCILYNVGMTVICEIEEKKYNY